MRAQRWRTSALVKWLGKVAQQREDVGQPDFAEPLREVAARLEWFRQNQSARRGRCRSSRSDYLMFS